jgi:aminoglycoside phosphotransferase (APT) family kinase protein
MHEGSRAARTEQMRQRCAAVFSPEFIARSVAPLCGEPGGADCLLQVVRLKGTRFTLRCAFPSGAVIYAKAYRGRQGSALFGNLRRLWVAGFNHGSPCRVPEPLAFLEDENIVLMREAQGRPLSRNLDDLPFEIAVEHVRAAARWLAALHATPISGFEREGACERSKILKEADILAEAAAAQPSRASALLGFLDAVHELAQAVNPSPQLTLTHGQFTPSTIFVDSGTVTAIDLDTLAVSDPAKDVATLMSKVKYRALFRAGGDAVLASRQADAFLDEYNRRAPENLANLQYYLALYCLKEFAKYIAAAGVDNVDRERAERLCRAELEPCLPKRSEQNKGPGRDTDADLEAVLSSSAARLSISVVQAKPTGRRTLRLTTESGACLYAKSYPDHLGRRCAKVAAALRAAGFGPNSPYSVPEVVAFRPDRSLLVIHAAEGVPLSTFFEKGNAAEALRGIREAARWLAALHRCAARAGRPEHEWISLKAFRVPARLIQVCAALPEQAPQLLEILYQLKHCVERLPAAESIVQTHGSFRVGHVFIAEGVTTAIDLDRSRPADPAKDVAEFAAELRSAAFNDEYECELAEEAAEMFLDEYFSQAPEIGARVSCYMACYLTLRMLKSLQAGAADAGWPARFGLYRGAIGGLCRKH